MRPQRTLLDLIQTEPDYRNGTCGWCVRALVSGVLPDGRTHYFCAAFPGCMHDGAAAMAKREKARASIIASLPVTSDD
jgi:uncharacterized ParB-like nuclease family protein